MQGGISSKDQLVVKSTRFEDEELGVDRSMQRDSSHPDIASRYDHSPPGHSSMEALDAKRQVKLPAVFSRLWNHKQ